MYKKYEIKCLELELIYIYNEEGFIKSLKTEVLMEWVGEKMTKYKKADIQPIDYSSMKLEGLFSFDREVIESPTMPLLHQAARFLLILEGDGIININGRDCRLKKGTLLAMMPWHFSEVTKVDKPLQYYILKYNVDIVNKFVKTLHDLSDNSNFLDLLYSKHTIYCDRQELEALKNIFESIKAELGEESVFIEGKRLPFTDVYVICRIIEIITLFVRKSDKEEEIDGAEPEEAEAADSDECALVNVFKYIYSHLGKNLSAESVANVFFTSKSTLTRYIKKTTGLSYENLVNEMKIGKILEMLLYTELSINEIAFILGFVDQSHLTKVFSHRVGKSPNKYRQIFGSKILLYNEDDIRLFYKILDYVVKNYSSDISIEVVSSEFGLTNSQLNEMFVYHVEKRFVDFLNFIRINNACKMLLNSDKNITNIAFEVGYNNSKTFLRNFSKIRGVAPSEFRVSGSLQEFDL